MISYRHMYPLSDDEVFYSIQWAFNIDRVNWWTLKPGIWGRGGTHKSRYKYCKRYAMSRDELFCLIAKQFLKAADTVWQLSKTSILTWCMPAYA